MILNPNLFHSQSAMIAPRIENRMPAGWNLALRGLNTKPAMKPPMSEPIIPSTVVARMPMCGPPTK